MNFNVVNRELLVGDVSITGVSSSSLFLIGDANYISLSSTFDTPAEALIIGPYVPLSLS
ncbi:spore gernimation protein GerPD [Priestia megaterium]|uniref:spore gernimation protein GerPD n=1 Tax=Priestia megaterium TaxID=1404 RepID=UPI002D7EBEC7|nr:spore gernimation protein GerPD [Priestia megaterium]MEB4859661.1 spore gernimation protein GerPD [Priestia megaterium]